MDDHYLDLLESDLNDPAVQYELGRCLLRGEGVEKNVKEAETWLQRAAEQGYAPAAELLDAGKPVPPAPKQLRSEEDLPEWCYRAEQGEVEAQFQTAMFLTRSDLPGARTDAGRYFLAAAEQGDARACLLLGAHVLKKSSKMQLPAQYDDPAHGVKWLQNAADCGVPQAAELLGEYYAAGEQKDPEQAEKYFIKNAQMGGPERMVALALRYTYGEGLPQSTVRALSWVKQAESAGMPDAQQRYQSEVARRKAREAEKKRKAEEAERRRAAEAAEKQRKQEEARLAKERLQQAKDHLNQAVQGATNWSKPMARETVAAHLRQAEQLGLTDALAQFKSRVEPLIAQHQAQLAQEAKEREAKAQEARAREARAQEEKAWAEHLKQQFADAERLYQARRYTEAVALLRKGATEGHGPSMYLLARCYLQGIGVTANRDIYIQHLLRAADAGHPQANYEYGQLLLEHCGADPQKKRTAYSYLTYAANHGVAQASYLVAKANGNTANPGRTGGQLARAALAGLPEAMCDYGEYLYLKMNQKKDGIAWLERAAEKKVSKAYMLLARFYTYGPPEIRNQRLAGKYQKLYDRSLSRGKNGFLSFLGF